MAIGSNPEVGVSFARWGDMTELDRLAWFTYMRVAWGQDLLGGFAKLAYPPCPDEDEYS